MTHLTYRELQSILKNYRNDGIIPACNVKLNSKREVLEATLIACLKFEKGLCQRKLDLNPQSSETLKKEWATTVYLNTRKLENLGVA